MAVLALAVSLLGTYTRAQSASGGVISGVFDGQQPRPMTAVELRDSPDGQPLHSFLMFGDGPIGDAYRHKYGAEPGEFRFPDLAPGTYFVRVAEPHLMIRGVSLRSETRTLKMTPLFCLPEELAATPLSDVEASEVLAIGFTLSHSAPRLVTNNLPSAWLSRLSPQVVRLTQRDVQKLSKRHEPIFFTQMEMAVHGRCASLKIVSRRTQKDPKAFDMSANASLYQFRRHDNTWDIDLVGASIS